MLCERDDALHTKQCVLLGVHVACRDAQKTIKKLREHGLLNNEFGALKHNNKVAVPLASHVVDETDVSQLLEDVEVEIAKISFRRKKSRPTTLKECLKGKLTPEEASLLVNSWNTLGNVIVLEIPDKLSHKSELIGNALLSLHKNVTTICRVEGKHEVGVHT